MADSRRGPYGPLTIAAYAPPRYRDRVQVTAVEARKAIYSYVVGNVATSIFAFITCWNEYILARILLNDQAKQTVTVWLSEFYGTSRQVDWGGLMAGSILAAIPVLIFFVFVQRKIAFGLTSGAVKG